MKQFLQPAFLPSSNIYEVNVRQYTPEGNFKAFMKHLPRLKEMGVEILWFMPIHPIGLERRKGTLGSYYSIKDFCDVNPEFGTKEDFRKLVEAIHNLGMKVILDWIANHAAWDNKWTITNPDFFVRDQLGNFKPPYDWDDVIQINHDNPEEQVGMIDAMEYWITEFDIDGYRADLAHLTPLLFWKKARQRLDTVKHDLVWLAETEDPVYHEAFDISFTWKWMHASEGFVKGRQDHSSLINILSGAAVEFHHALRMYFTANHDENSWNGTEYEKYGIYAKAFAVFSMTFINSVPLIYSGQELPNTKRLKFFDKDAIEWNTGITLHEFYKTLLDLRKTNPLFQSNEPGSISFIKAKFPTLAYQRSSGENSIIVVLNISAVVIDTKINIINGGSYKNIFSYEVSHLENELPFKLQPGDFLVLEKIYSK